MNFLENRYFKNNDGAIVVKMFLIGKQMIDIAVSCRLILSIEGVEAYNRPNATIFQTDPLEHTPS